MKTQEVCRLRLWQKAWVWLTLAFTVTYLVWRGFETLNPEAPLYSALFLVTEVFAFLGTAQFVLSAYKLRHREAPVLNSLPTVDVLIATYNEDTALLMTTIRSCVALDYAHETYVLDDGNRPEVRALALELGAKYLARGNNAGAKAGNLNHALSLTHGEIVAVIDADGVPRHDFLTRLLGYFDDSNVALVQVPQTFYNIDSFQHANKRTGEGEIWHEQALFFDIIQAGRDYLGAAMCCGSGSLVRRSALEQIGNIPTETLTEDMHLSLKLHAAGFKTVYHSEALAFALAPATLREFVVQRARWATGCYQVFFKELGIIFGPSRLSFAQRYLAIPFYYSTAIQRVVYIFASLHFLLGGAAPMTGPDSFPLLIMANMTLSIGTYYILARGRARLVLSETYFLYNLVPYIKAALVAALPFIRLRFKVTSKKLRGEHSDALLLLPIGLLLLASSYAVTSALIDIAFDGSTSAQRWSIGFGLVYIALSVSALIRAGKKSTWHEAYSFFDPRPVRILHLGRASSQESDFGIATAMSERHIKLYRTQPLMTGSQIGIEVTLPQSSLTLQAEVVSCSRQGPEDLYQITVRYPELKQSLRAELLNYFFEDATPRIISDFAKPLHFKTITFQESERRNIERISGLVPVLIREEGQHAVDMLALCADLSESGSRVQIRTSLPMGSVVEVSFPWSQRSVRARIVRRGGGVGGRQGGNTHEIGLQFDAAMSGMPSQTHAAKAIKTELPA